MKLNLKGVKQVLSVLDKALSTNHNVNDFELTDNESLKEFSMKDIHDVIKYMEVGGIIKAEYDLSDSYNITEITPYGYTFLKS
ncbi:hypothetical protein MOB49_11550 [Bacillus haynesii]|uniref:hypothetical protein n=1 Tax=Bacillus haynesii TaxID=1925021 RepID=UPI00227EA7D0|nr:hypothetical protein [Bacillus haynesii]MCY7967728.1 hypothetical protein [Bacillus haynesii]